MNANLISSIYIPRVISNVNEEMIYNEFMNFLPLGPIKRIDFTEINAKPGFKENYEYDNGVKSVFVHFHHIFDNDISKNVINMIQTRGRHIYYPQYTKGFWVILPNKNPVKQTLMNTSQIVENARFLEEKVEEQNKTIEELKVNVVNLQLTMVKLIGGLFSEKQKNGSDELLNILLNKDPNSDKTKKTMWQYQPTTRQGDKNENNIYSLSIKMNEIINIINEMAGFDENTSSSSNSSSEDNSSDSEDNSSESTQSSMPDLLTIYDGSDSDDDNSIN